MGVYDFRRIKKFIKLFELSVEDKIKPAVDYFRGLNVNIVDLIQRYPNAIANTVEHSKKIVEYLKSQQVNEVELINMFPPILGSHVEDKISPTIDLIKRITQTSEVNSKDIYDFMLMNISGLLMIERYANEIGKPIKSLEKIKKVYRNSDKYLKSRDGRSLATWISKNKLNEKLNEASTVQTAESLNTIFNFYRLIWSCWFIG